LSAFASAADADQLPPRMEKSLTNPKIIESTSPEDRTFEQELIEKDIMISKFFGSVAEGLDLFLVGKQVTDRRNDTHVKIQNSTFSNDGQKIRQTPSLLVNLRLPNVEDYWSLKFTSYDENEDRRNIQQSYLGQVPRQRNYGATIGLFQKLGNIRTSFQPRIELQNPLRISHSLMFESVADMKSYKINPELELFANPSDGVGTYFAVNFNIPFSIRNSLTFINNGEYDEKQHKFSVFNGFSIGHFISRFSSLSYDFIVNSTNRDNYHLDSYSLAVGYSHVLYRNIFDYQLIPHWDFLKTSSFVGKPGLTLILTVTF
jgi:hypothetical protein